MDLGQRYVAIQDKEAELRRREDALRKQDVTVDDAHPPNFPPFCSTVYHDISVEIPIAMQWTVRIAFISLWVAAVMFVINLIAACVVGKFSGDYSTGQNIVFAIIFGILTVPLAFKINYFRFYTQCKNNDITLGYLALQGVYFVFITIGAVGIKNSGMIGIMCMIDAIAGNGNGFVKAITSIATILWVAQALVQLFLCGRVLMLFKSAGRTLEAQHVQPTEGYSQAQ